jgi:hypothetical protein
MCRRELRKERRRRRVVKSRLEGEEEWQGFFVAGIKTTKNFRRL